MTKDETALRPEEIAEMREYCEKAAKGPWKKCKSSYGDDAPSHWIGSACKENVAEAFGIANVNFISLSRIDLPRVLIALEASYKRIEELEEGFKGTILEFSKFLKLIPGVDKTRVDFMETLARQALASHPVGNRRQQPGGEEKE